MKDFAKKRKNKISKIYSLPVLIFGILIVGLLIKANVEIYSKVAQSRERKELNEFEFNELSKRKEELQAQVNRIDSRIGIEEELRKRFGVAKEDEKLVILYDEEKPIPEKLPQEKKTFFQKIKSWFSE